MREKLEANNLGENHFLLNEIEEILNSCAQHEFADFSELSYFFKKNNFESLNNSQILNTVKKFNKKIYLKNLIVHLKFKRSEGLLRELKTYGDVVLFKTFFNSLFQYCEENKLLNHATSLVDNFGKNLEGRKESKAKSYQIEFQKGNFKYEEKDIGEDVLKFLLNSCNWKKAFKLEEKLIFKIINSHASYNIMKNGSNKEIKTLLLILATSLNDENINKESLEKIGKIVDCVDNTFINIKSRDISKENKRLKQIKELINKSKVLSNLKRADLLENILFELKGIDKGNAWLQYLEDVNNFKSLTNKERENIFSYYESLFKPQEENIKTKSIEKEIREYLKSASFEEYSDLYFMSYSLGISDLSLHIAEKLIVECKTNDELVNGLVLKIKSIMAMGDWLTANKVIDEVLEEIPIKAIEKRTLLRLKIKCLDSLNLCKEANSSRKALLGLEQVD